MEQSLNHISGTAVMGSLTGVVEVPCYVVPLGVTHNFSTSSLGLINGGQAAFSSVGASRSFELNWRGSVHDVQTVLNKLFTRNTPHVTQQRTPGLNKRYSPYLYFRDPTQNGRNLFPLGWAMPGQYFEGSRYFGPSIFPEGTQVDTSQAYGSNYVPYAKLPFSASKTSVPYVLPFRASDGRYLVFGVVGSVNQGSGTVVLNVKMFDHRGIQVSDSNLPIGSADGFKEYSIDLESYTDSNGDPLTLGYAEVSLVSSYSFVGGTLPPFSDTAYWNSVISGTNPDIPPPYPATSNVAWEVTQNLPILPVTSGYALVPGVGIGTSSDSTINLTAMRTAGAGQSVEITARFATTPGKLPQGYAVYLMAGDPPLPQLLLVSDSNNPGQNWAERTLVLQVPAQGSISYRPAIRVVNNNIGAVAGKPLMYTLGTDKSSKVLDTAWFGYGWGDNSSGQLGDGTTTNRELPVAMVPGAMSSTEIAYFASTQTHTVIIADDGKCYAHGANNYGQLGDGSTTTRTSPVRVATTGVMSSKTITRISVGTHHTLFVDSDGVAYACGRNTNGQLGDGTTTRRTTPVAVGGAVSGKNIVYIAAGDNNSFFVDEDGIAYACGANTNGKLGDGTTTQRLSPVSINMSGVLAGEKIAVVSARTNHTIAVTAKGQPVGWGANSFGQLGKGDTAGSNNPVLPIMNGVLDGKQFVQVMATNNYTLLLDRDGGVYGYGQNVNGQLGNGSTSNQSTPVATSLANVPTGDKIVYLHGNQKHVVALTENGIGLAWGDNSSGQLGDGTTTNRLTPVQIYRGGELAGKTLETVNAGLDHTLLTDTNNSIYVIGSNADGQLGDGSISQTEPTPLPNAIALIDSVEIKSVDKQNTIALEKLVAAQLGVGTLGDINDPSYDIAAGRYGCDITSTASQSYLYNEKNPGSQTLGLTLTEVEGW